jgi:hypothetical protein
MPSTGLCFPLVGHRSQDAPWDINPFVKPAIELQTARRSATVTVELHRYMHSCLVEWQSGNLIIMATKAVNLGGDFFQSKPKFSHRLIFVDLFAQVSTTLVDKEGTLVTLFIILINRYLDLDSITVI